MSLPTRFVKMAGGGNDFLLFEADGRSLSQEDHRRISLLCRRGLSVGADGALFLSGGGEGRIHLDYFNADGGLASFCANGTRCAARYAVTRRLVAGETLILETGWAPISAHVSGEKVTLRLPALSLPGEPLPIFGEGLPGNAVPIEVGVPHLVVFVSGDLVTPPVVCVTQSGVAFTVTFIEREGAIVEAALTGDAREIFSAELNEEAWKD